MSKPDSGREYHRKATGAALETVKRHENDEDITLFGSCFCPFVQRVWVAFEALDLSYKYYEVDPYKKPKDLLEVSPKGLVPGLKLHKYDPPRALNESTVIMEYLEDLAIASGKSGLLPPVNDAYARALVRLQADHISRSFVPAFYRYIQAQEEGAQIEAGKEFHTSIEGLVALFERMETEISGGSALGLWMPDNANLGFADILAGPWLFRATNVLKHYRGFEMPKGDKFTRYIERLLNHPFFMATCSTEELYLDSYERYAYNRPNTSQVANAINSGRGLP